jgi:dipeptidyl aminopeptidase/acylaminoacyl peptidase
MTPDGNITAVTEPNRAAGELSHRWPQPLPEGQGLLFTAIDTSAQASVMVQPPSGDSRPLVRNASGGRFVPPDRLLYQQNGALYMVPFSVARLEVAGPAAQVLEQVGTTNTAGPLYAVSATGTVIALATATVASTQFVVDWMNPSGAFDPLLTRPRTFGSLQLSPDENTLALHVMEGPNDIWLHDLRRQVSTPLTVDPNEDRAPVWSPDGRWIAFASRRGGADSNVWLMRSDGTGEAIRLTNCECFAYPTSWHPSGRLLAITQNTNSARVAQSRRPGNRSDVNVLPLPDLQQDFSGGFVPEMPQPVVATSFPESEAAFSVDGEWLAYESGESQTREVWVQPFPGPGKKTQISSGGGAFPVWAPDGRRLFYYGGDRRIWAVDFTVEAGDFRPGRARRWSNAVVEERAAPRGRNFAVSKTGDRIAVFRKPPSQAARPTTNLTVVANAFAGREPPATVK